MVNLILRKETINVIEIGKRNASSIYSSEYIDSKK